MARRSPMKGWARAKPDTVAERKALARRCKGRCFLLPEERKYPVCAKGSATCKPDCRGLLAAYSRAKANVSRGLGRKHLDVSRKSLWMARAIGCPWARRTK